MIEQYDFLETPTLSKRNLLEAARLSYIAFEDFYNIFSKDNYKMISVISDHLNNFSELNQKLVCQHHNKLVGICSYYKTPEMNERQTSGLKSLLEISGNIASSMRSLRMYRQNFSTPSNEGMYISRFAVNELYRGSGLALDLLKTAEKKFKKVGAKKKFFKRKEM